MHIVRLGILENFDGYDTIEECNVDSKAECDQLNLAHETKTKKQTEPRGGILLIRYHEVVEAN